MMLAHRLTTCLLLLTALGCQTETDTVMPEEAFSANAERTTVSAENLRVKQMVASGNNGGLGPMFVTTYFNYSEGTKLEKVTIPTETYAGLTTYLYTYDEQGRMTGSRFLRESPTDNGIRGQQIQYTFTDSTIVEKYMQVDTEGNLLPYYTEPNFKITSRLNAQGQIYEQFHEGVWIWGSETTQLFRFTYENGNIVKSTVINAAGQVESTTYYEYDDKVNPFYQNMYMFSPVRYSSRNNIISARNGDKEPQRTEYTYNEQGLPLTKKNVSSGAVLTYEYETF